MSRPPATSTRKPTRGGARRLLAAAALAGLVASSGASHKAAAQGGGVALLRDAEIERILREDADPVFKAAGLNPRDVTIYLVGDKELNAFVSGGQNVFLNTGLIVRTENPNELLGVIAHETGHIASGHLARRDEAVPGLTATRMISMGLGVLAAVAAPDPSAAIGLIYAGDMLTAMQAARYTRIQESAADQAAAKFLEGAGQSGKGLVDFFDNFRSQEVFSEARRYAYFRSHPLSSDRIEALRQRVSTASNFDVVDPPEEMEKHRIMVAKIRGFMNYPQQTYQDYPETDQSFPARYARAIAHYKALETERALKDVDALIAEQPVNPFLHELKGQILFESGRTAESVEPYARSVELLPDEPLLRTAYGQTLLALQTPEATDQAVAELERALLPDRDNPMAWRLLAEAYERQGNAGMARLAVAEQNFALGQLMPARQFGIRARELLPEGTPQHRRATDIINASEASLMRRPRS